MNKNKSSVIITCLLGLILSLSACSKPPEFLVASSPQPVLISMSASLALTQSALNACARTIPGLALLVEIQPSSTLESDKVDLSLWLGDKPAHVGFAAPIAQEQVRLIVNPVNPLETIDRTTLRQILEGQITEWSQIGVMPGKELSLWVYPPEDEVQRAIERLLGDELRITTFANLAADPESLRTEVESDQNAIGFLPAAWLTSGVKTVEIEAPDIDLPILALAEKEPQGMVRQYLACLQGPVGQESLRTYYRSSDPEDG